MCRSEFAVVNQVSGNTWEVLGYTTTQLVQTDHSTLHPRTADYSCRHRELLAVRFKTFHSSAATKVGRDSSDGIASRYELDGPGIESH